MPVDDTLTKANISSSEAGINMDVYFNPKELQVDKTIPWNEHKNTEGNDSTLEFTNSKPKEMNMELMFDGFEDETDVYDEYISQIETLTMVDDSLKRPPMCLFTWGSALPTFQGVIESMSVKYTLFLPDGTPVRATVTLKWKQADQLKNAAEAKADAQQKQSSQGVQANASNAARLDNVGAQAGVPPRDVANNSNIDNMGPGGVPHGAPLTTKRGG
jgi:hypothetical protein